MMRRSAALILLGLLIPATAIAQAQTGTVEGSVSDAEDGLPLVAANIVVEGTVLGTMTDREGNYRLPGIPLGPQRIVFSVIGYETAVREVTIREGPPQRIDVALVPSPLELPDIVVTAGRQEQRAELAAASVQVLTARELQLRMAPRLDLVLPLIPGVTMVEDQLGIRGSTGYTKGAGGRVLVLMDGVPTLGGDTGNVRWDTLPSEVVERIEVVKGAASALYGSSAMGGVVNVLTRSAHSGPSAYMRLRAGTWERPHFEEYHYEGQGGLTRAGDLTIIRPLGKFGLLASGGYEYTDGYRENGWNRYGHMLLKLEGPSGNRDRWSAALTAARHEYGNFFEWRGPNDPYEVAPSVLDDWVRSDKLMLTSTWRHLYGKSTYLQLQPHMFAVRWKNNFRDNDDRATVVRGALDAQVVTSSRIGTITVGGMAAVTDVDATMYGSLGVWEGALYAQNETELGRGIRTSIGLRYDSHDSDDVPHRSVVSPRAALILAPSTTITLRVSGGRGFRAPSVAETYISTTTSGFTIIPNLGLEPETVWTGELGGTWLPLPFLLVEGALFDSRYESMIEPERQPDGNIQFKNLTRASLRGAEVSLKGTLPSGWFRYGWSHLWLKSRDLDRDVPLQYRRPRSGSLVLEVLGKGWVVAADWLYGDTIQRVGVYPYDRRGPFRRLDGRFSVEALGMRWILHGRNLTGYAYTDIERNLSPPREWIISLERSW